MPRKKTVDDEQQDLIPDLQAANAPQIKKVARAYRSAMKERVSWLEEEKTQKEKLLALLKEAHLQPLENGVIKCRLNGMVITVTPRDELVRVKEDGEDEGEE